MTTWYLDPEGGLDTNAGTSFAARKQHLSAITLAAGDAIRIIASPSPISLGVAAWADNSGTITLGAAQTLTADNAETAWTGAANITSTTSATNRKQGSFCLSLAIAAAFTGGLVAYKALPSTTDFSPYSCISCWMYLPAIAAGTGLSIALCSDSAGATPVATLPLPPWLVAYANGLPLRPLPILFENGGAALPSGINSIAIYATGKPFTGTFFVDNIIATTAYGAAGHLSHGCLIGKNSLNEPEWYPLMSIDGTTVVLGNQVDFSNSAPLRKYRGTSESVTTYSLCPLRTRSTTAQSAFAGAAGSATAPNTVTGGWDRATMSSQTGQSWLSGENVQNYGINYSTTPLGWTNFPDATVGLAHHTTTALYGYNTTGQTVHLAGIVDCGGSGAAGAVNRTNGGNTDYALGNVMWGGGITMNSLPQSPVKLDIRRLCGCVYTAGAVQFSDNWVDDLTDIQIGMIDNCQYGITMVPGARARVRGTTFQNNILASVYSGGASGYDLILDRPVLNDANLYSSISGGTIRCTAVGGARWDNRSYAYAATQRAVQTPVHGSTAQSVSLTINNYASLAAPTQPYVTRIARVAALAGKTITYSVWMQRTSATYITAGLLVRGSAVAGVGSQSVQGSAAANTWEQVTLNVTPTEDGVVDIYAWIVASGSIAANGNIAYFGDSAVSST